MLVTSLLAEFKGSGYLKKRYIVKAAKKALAKWQYAPKQNFKESYEVIFKFSAEQN